MAQRHVAGSGITGWHECGFSFGRIIFSRHAKRRLKLYKISERWLETVLSSKQLSTGKHTVFEESPEHALPIKTVIKVCEDEMMIITSYPLKKGK
ncbi:MAG: DUF4258 domain-containing protein [SAR324 cluster bacterium]|nr:DUF4258 domain-containing protein [SAR324 cluster bacterium]